MEPIDGIVMGKVNFELTLEAMGLSTGSNVNYAMHVLQTNIRYEEDEFNLFKERRDKGIKGAIVEREKFYGEKVAKPKK